MSFTVDAGLTAAAAFAQGLLSFFSPCVLPLLPDYLRVGPLYTQAAIKSERAVRQLRWLGAERIERADEAQLRAEKDAFLRVFAAELDQL